MELEDEMLDSFTNSVDMSLSKLRETVKGRDAWCAAVHGVTKSQICLATRTRKPYYLNNNIGSSRWISSKRGQIYVYVWLIQAMCSTS